MSAACEGVANVASSNTPFPEVREPIPELKPVGPDRGSGLRFPLIEDVRG